MLSFLLVFLHIAIGLILIIGSDTSTGKINFSAKSSLTHECGTHLLFKSTLWKKSILLVEISATMYSSAQVLGQDSSRFSLTVGCTLHNSDYFTTTSADFIWYDHFLHLNIMFVCASLLACKQTIFDVRVSSFSLAALI